MRFLGLLNIQLIVTITITSLALCESHTYYVTPTPPPNPHCVPSKPCHTLAYYQNNREYLENGTRNVTLHFLSGVHTLSLDNDSKQQLEFLDFSSLVISGVAAVDAIEKPSKPDHECIIRVPYISIRNVSLLRIQNCHLIGSFLEVAGIGSLLVYDFAFTNTSLFVTTTASTQLINTRLSFGSITQDYFSMLSLLDSHFESTKVRLIANLDAEETSHSFIRLGNSTLSQTLLYLYLGNGYHEVVLEDFNFLGQNSRFIGHIRQSVSNVTNHSSATINIAKSSFRDNSAGIQMISEGVIEMSISECKFQRNQRGLSVTATKGGFHALVENTVFDRLNHSMGLQTYFFASTTYKLNENVLILRNVSYLQNSVSVFLGALVLSGPLNLTIENCVFNENIGLISTLFLRSITVLFKGKNYFTNNLGSTGGAMHMSYSSYLQLDKGVHVIFENNTATNLGGAIFLEKTGHKTFLDVLFSAETKAKCFYQLTEFSSDLPVLSFLNNSAEMGGDSIYGTSLASDCEITPNGSVTSNQVKDLIFKFPPSSLSSVTSTPKRVCLCENNVPQCDRIDYTFWDISVTSGELFNVSLALVGDDFGTVTGVVYASNSDDIIADDSLGAGQKQQQIATNKICSDIEYSIHSKAEEVTIFLSTDIVTASSLRAVRNTIPFSKEALALASSIYNERGIIEFNLLNAPVSITVTILPCPIGFVLNTPDLVCDCENFFSQYSQSCNVENRTGFIRRNETTWLSATVSEGNSSGTILANNFCPFGYCVSKSIAISLDQPNEQCDFNHSGILCGGCLPGFSLAIGSSRCLQCSDERQLSLLLAFISAGIGLVLLIKVLDLTVARGTVNGLIFYANIMWINQKIFFPSGSEQSSYNVTQFYQIVRVFVAWLNLDLGIETCFFTGLNAYWKTWFQFVFSFYLWILAALIVVACHYSSVMTKLFGNNAVAVLATVILLSYIKLLRTIVTILSFANLQQYNPSGIKTVWLEDGNIPYLGTRHSIIFTAALLVLFLLWLPFTAILLLIPFLKRYSNFRITGWANKYKPFFDSFFGPLEDNHNYRIGLTLLVRVVLAILAAATQAFNPIINIDLAVVSSVFLIIPLRNTYRKKYNFILELSFLINIAITGIAYLSTSDTYSRVVFTSVSGLISFISFLVILVFHIYTSLVSLCLYCHKNSSNTEHSDTACTPNVPRKEMIRSRSDDPSSFVTRTTIELRECILEN